MHYEDSLQTAMKRREVKGKGTRDQIANIRWIIIKATEFQKIIYFCFIDYNKAFDYMDHNKLWKILQEIGIPYHLTCLEKFVCRSGSKLELDIDKKRSTPTLYIVTLLI